MKKQNNYAFIDSQNINLGIQTLGWKLDWRRFRVYLQDKYKISNENVFFHRKFSPVKTCPGSLLNQEWLNKFLERPVPVVIPPKPVENMCVAQEKEIAKLKEQLAWYDKLLTWFFSKIA